MDGVEQNLLERLKVEIELLSENLYLEGFQSGYEATGREWDNHHFALIGLEIEAILQKQFRAYFTYKGNYSFVFRDLKQLFEMKIRQKYLPGHKTLIERMGRLKVEIELLYQTLHLMAFRDGYEATGREWKGSEDEIRLEENEIQRLLIRDFERLNLKDLEMMFLGEENRKEINKVKSIDYSSCYNKEVNNHFIDKETLLRNYLQSLGIIY